MYSRVTAERKACTFCFILVQLYFPHFIVVSVVVAFGGYDNRKETNSLCRKTRGITLQYDGTFSISVPAL